MNFKRFFKQFFLSHRTLKLFIAFGFVALVNVSCSAPDLNYSTLIQNTPRSPEDLQADLSRKPVDFLSFTQVKPGMQVLDLAAGGGYTTSLLSMAVGPQGHVWAQLNKPNEALNKRLAQGLNNVTVALTPMNAPIPQELPALDMVTLVLSYHDIAFMPLDRIEMNRSIFRSLKAGGTLILIDHAAKPGSKLEHIKTLHRIDENQVIEDFTSVGFKLKSRSQTWANPNDPRQEMFSKMTQPDDRFALEFIKP
jgi:predicted methyltransferase